MHGLCCRLHHAAPSIRLERTRQGILGDGSRVLLVKNLPYSTRENEIESLFCQALGSTDSAKASIERIVLPPSRAICVVVFKLSQDARTVFKKLAYRRFKQAPLYLQFLPNEVIGEGEKRSRKSGSE